MEEIRFTQDELVNLASLLDYSAELLSDLPEATLPLFLTYQVLAVLIDRFTP